MWKDVAHSKSLIIFGDMMSTIAQATGSMEMRKRVISSPSGRELTQDIRLPKHISEERTPKGRHMEVLLWHTSHNEGVYNRLVPVGEDSKERQKEKVELMLRDLAGTLKQHNIPIVYTAVDYRKMGNEKHLSVTVVDEYYDVYAVKIPEERMKEVMVAVDSAIRKAFSQDLKELSRPTTPE